MNKSHLTEQQLLQNEEDLFSANTTIFHGLQQYWTPEKLARWLYDVVVDLYKKENVQHTLVCDLTAGAGNLLQPYTHTCGVEVDKTVIKSGKNIVNADLVKFYSYLQQGGIQFDIMALNPPYAEYWPRKVFVSDALEGEKIESQIATILAASSLLNYNSLGYAVVSAKILEKLQREVSGILAVLTVDGVFKPHSDVLVGIVWFCNPSSFYYDQDQECYDFGVYTLETLPDIQEIVQVLRKRTRSLYAYDGTAARQIEEFKKVYKLYREDQRKTKWTYNLEVQARQVRLSFNNFQRNI